MSSTILLTQNWAKVMSYLADMETHKLEIYVWNGPMRGRKPDQTVVFRYKNDSEVYRTLMDRLGTKRICVGQLAMRQLLARGYTLGIKSGFQQLGFKQ